MPARAAIASALLAFAAAHAQASEPITLSSGITEVTVYADRAEITRVAKRSLDAGEQVVAFKGLPPQIDQNSIQVNGSGPAVLQDIKFERRQLDKTPHEKLQRLDTQLEQLQDSLRAIDDNTRHAHSEAKFVQSIADGLTRDNSKETPVELDPAKWAQMVTFYRDKLDALDRQVRADEARRRRVAEELDRVQRERSELTGASEKVSNDVDVTLTVKSAGTVTLQLTYIVYGASWGPVYDLRVSSDTRKMAVTYKAQVRQNTSEPWEGVKVRLSTANPQRGGQHPELSPWYLSFYQPMPLQRRRAQEESDDREAPAMKQMMSNEMPVEGLAEKLKASAPMEVATAQVETRSTSVLFVPEGTSTIQNDNQPSTVVIAELSFPAQFRYSTVPKLSPYAYLKAKAKNSSDYPLLPGSANVFFDNAFVTTSSMNLVAPTEEFWTFLGVDEAMKVEHKLIKRFDEEGGKKTKVTWEYRILLENKKKTAEELVVWDQLPISSTEDIVVECIEPKYKEDTPALKKNEHQFFEWYFKLEPGQKATIPFSFSVKYPTGRSISGL